MRLYQKVFTTSGGAGDGDLGNFRVVAEAAIEA
jgi:hypothetical protein